MGIRRPARGTGVPPVEVSIPGHGRDGHATKIRLVPRLEFRL